jgi:hypothetical protein
MKAFTLTHEEMTRMINEGVDNFLNALEKEGHISAEQYDTFKQYRCVIGERTLWGRMWDFFTFQDNDNKNASYIVVVKVISHGRKKTESNEE